MASRYDIDLNELNALSPELRLAWFWLLMNAQAYESAVGNDRYHFLSYDNLCESPSIVANALVKKLGLDFDAQTSDFLAHSRTDSRSYYSVQQNSKHASTKWETTLESRVIDAILKITEPFLRLVEGE
ncbi:MAG TPA: hypothetical protein DDZ51_17595 [Planctomycetaceae bacterium]|nr:hypothetical protein [Planctomycetaceae bacterium]